MQSPAEAYKPCDGPAETLSEARQVAHRMYAAHMSYAAGVVDLLELGIALEVVDWRSDWRPREPMCQK